MLKIIIIALLIGVIVSMVICLVEDLVKSSSKSDKMLWVENEIKKAVEYEKNNPTFEPTLSKDLQVVIPTTSAFRTHAYMNALKAYKNFTKGSCVGEISMHMMIEVLTRINAGDPLTPITGDEPDDWVRIFDCPTLETYYCSRKRSLFKEINKIEGSISYDDWERCVYIDTETGEEKPIHPKLYTVVNDQFPITMPYYPTSTIRVYGDTFLSTNNKEIGLRSDTASFLYSVVDGEESVIDRYFKYKDGIWLEINSDEFMERYSESISVIEE